MRDVPDPQDRAVDRRRFLAIAGGGAVAIGLAACGGSSGSSSSASSAASSASSAASSAATSAASAASSAVSAATSAAAGGAASIVGGGGGDGTIKIGYVTPKTGALAPFGAADDFIIKGVQDFLKDGLQVGGKSYAVQVLVEDSESDPNRAGEKAGKLINDDGIDLMLVASTPETTNPVADQCEANGVPCISTVAPWQPWVIGRKGEPGKVNFDWTYHFFWGLEDVIATFLAIWGQVDTNKAVGGLFPNDGDGNAWGDKTVGFPPALEKAGYTLADPGRYENGNADFTAQISAFKSAKAEIVTGVVIPPDFPTFWKQAKQQGFTPKVASIGKALLFPESIKALGADGVNLSSEIWWSPNHPYSSSLTGQTSKEVADAYTAATGNQWTQPIGFIHALFEVAAAALVAAGSTDKGAVRDAIKALKVDTIVGGLDWAGTPIGNVAKTKLVGGQWRTASTPTGYDLVVVDNSGNPDVPTGGSVEPIGA